MSEKEADGQPDAEQDTTNIQPPPENLEQQQEQEFEQEKVQIEEEGEEYVAHEETADEEEEEEQQEEEGSRPAPRSQENLELTGEEEEEEIELTEEELEALFNKNTESFRCLAQILLSRSSLLRHPLFHFPPLLDPGIDAAFNYVGL